VNRERLRIRLGAFVAFTDCHERRLVLASKTHWTSIVGQAAAHPATFGVVLLYALLWLMLDRASFDWNAVATLAVWIMTCLSGAPTGAIRWRSMRRSMNCFGLTKCALGADAAR
jgi:hypothetical protein